MKCRHYKGSGYRYDIDDKEALYLCEQCNLNLAPEIMKQMAIEVFAGSMIASMEEDAKEKKKNAPNKG